MPQDARHDTTRIDSAMLAVWLISFIGPSANEREVEVEVEVEMNKEKKQKRLKLEAKTRQQNGSIK